MKNDFIEFIGNARNRKSEKFRHQLSIFLVCLILSVFFWMLVRLSKDYYYAIEYRLKYTNYPANYKLSGFSDSTLTLKIKLQGYEFLSEKFVDQNDREFEVSLENLRVRNTDSNPWGYILTNRLGKEIIAQTNFNSDVYFVTPDTLFFKFENTNIHRIPSRSVILKRDSLMLRSDSTIKFVDPSHIYVKKH
ncbi:MAG: hypothetical protein PHF97_07165 [Bacteroidales bacterium]|nr:hypothetical protein [Bacteroidales bacterium]